MPADQQIQTPPKVDGNSDIKMIGFLVSNDRDKIKNKKPELLAEFDKRVGHKRYSPTNFYDLDETIAYQKAAIELMYGDDNPHNYYEFGKWDYDEIMNSQFGKILKSLFMKDFETALISIPKIFKSIMRGMKFSAQKLSDKVCEIDFGLSKWYPSEYWRGFFEAHMKAYNVSGKVVVQDRGGVRKITVTWE